MNELGLDKGVVAKLVEGSLASIAADDFTATTAGRAEVIIILLHPHVSRCVMLIGTIKARCETWGQGGVAFVSSDGDGQSQHGQGKAGIARPRLQRERERRVSALPRLLRAKNPKPG